MVNENPMAVAADAGVSSTPEPTSTTGALSVSKETPVPVVKVYVFAGCAWTRLENSSRASSQLQAAFIG